MSYRNVSWLGFAFILALGIAGPRMSLGKDSEPAPAPLQTPSQSHAQPGAQAQTGAQPSLGDIARKARAEQARSPGKPVKEYTNANLPSGSGGLTVVGPPPAAAAAGAAEAKRGPAYFSSRMAELQQNLDVHQRELAVLQQRLGQNQVQFYSDPNKQLQEQYSRSDIDKVTAAIEQKKQQVEADQKAISDLQQEVQAQGGSSDWLSGGTAAPKADLSGVEKGSQKYWQLRFEAARKAVEQADREQKLSGDELDLLKAQQAHEMASAAAADRAQEVAAKQAQAESARAAAEKAHQELDTVQQEFDQSGAPAEWSQPEQPQ
jgi:hypothetical protein